MNGWLIVRRLLAMYVHTWMVEDRLISILLLPEPGHGQPRIFDPTRILRAFRVHSPQGIKEAMPPTPIGVRHADPTR
jgi:hypothetical protein